MHVIERLNLWSGLAAIGAGAAGLYFGRDLDIGKAGMVGPGAFPLALSAGLVLVGLVLLGEAVTRRPEMDDPYPPRSFFVSPVSIVAALLALGGLGLLIVGQHRWPEFFLSFGPAEWAATFLLVLLLCAVAAGQAPGGSLFRGLGAVFIGLLLATMGLDSVTGTVRYMPPDAAELTFVNGLVLAFFAYVLGFNPLVIAVAYAFSGQLENPIRQALLVSQGDPTVFVRSAIGAALVGASAAVLVIGAWLRWR
jgi:TctA family transporter